jgi:riboflavin kinase/FMN adenylyltransferase
LAWEDRHGERLALIPLSIPLLSPEQALGPTAIALGSFDGLHRGHRRVIAAVTAEATPEQAGGDQPVPSVVSFWPHPREVLHGETRLRLDLPEEKLDLLAPLGIRQLVLIPFTLDLAALSPEDFVRTVLVDQLQARLVAVGENFRFGAGRSGSAADLARIGADCGIAVRVLPMLWDGAERVSSSRIRRALVGGDLEEAARLLERPYRFAGRVVPGKGLGRQLGWPTANLLVDGRKFLPAEGVYAVWVRVAGDPGAPQPGVMNLGPQPTIDPESPSAVEVHLLTDEPGEGTTIAGDSDGAADNGRVPDLRGAVLSIEPVRLLRQQRRFTGLEELSAAIAADAEAAWRLLADAPAQAPGPIQPLL